MTQSTTKCNTCGAPRSYQTSKCRYCKEDYPVNPLDVPKLEESILNYKMKMFNNLFGGYTTEYLQDNTVTLGMHPGEIRTSLR